jgi:hypothetical protein
MLSAQALVDTGIDDRIEALNAVLAFRADLGGDSTLIARCRIPTAKPDSSTIPGLEQRFQRLLARPDTVLSRDEVQCPVMGFADAKYRVLWLEQVVEITRSAPTLPPYRSKQFEFVFQLLKGPSYREFQRYVVEPDGVSPLPNRSGVQANGWRVVEYRLVGWDCHWGDNLGHGSGVRRPPPRAR